MIVEDTAHIKGLSKLNTYIQTFPVKFEKSCLRGGLRRGAKQVLLPAVQGNLTAAGAVKTGELIKGLKVKTSARRGRVTASVVAGGKHGHLMRWIEYGVQAHDIAGKAGGMLAFMNIFAKTVHHPGFKGRGSMRKALDQGGPTAAVVAGEYMRDRLEKVGVDAADIEVSEGL